MPDPTNAVVPRATGNLARRLWSTLTLPYWYSERKWRVRGVTLLLLLLTVAQVGLSVWGNYWNRGLFDALEARSVRGVLIQAGVFALIFVSSIAVTAAHLMVKRWLQLDWRRWLTDLLVGRWMADGRHYRLLFSDGSHDNPDQRIAEDIRIATDGALGLAHTLFYSLLSLSLFVRILWSVSGSMAVPGTDVRVPGYMVPLAFLYAGIGTGLGWLLGRPLSRATNALQTAEANFRFGLARAREHSEAIALLRGERNERRSATERFRQIVHDYNWQSVAFMGLISFSTGYGGLLPVFPLLVAAPQYIAGVMTLGVLMQAAQAFQQLTSALSWPVDNAAGIAVCRTSAERVLSLHEDIGQLEAELRAPDKSHVARVVGGPDRLVLEDVAIADSTGQIVLEHLDAAIRRGERVLVCGDSMLTNGLFKAIAGLWPWGSGRIVVPDGSVMFIAQRPYLPEETLRDALCYPRPPDACDHDAIVHALRCAGADWLAPRLDERANWEQILPARAQQRLSFARAFMLRPDWLFMQEATDSFDKEGERAMFVMLRQELPNTTLLTIGFHEGLEPLHERKIVLTRVREAKYLPVAPAASIAVAAT
jgi:putative ATP-binding cassette transporter